MKNRSILTFFSCFCSIDSSLNSLLTPNFFIMPWFNPLHCFLLHRRSSKAFKKQKKKKFFLLLTDTMNLFAFEVNQIIQSVFISISNVVFCSLSCFLWFLKDSLFYFVPLFFFFYFFYWHWFTSNNKKRKVYKKKAILHTLLQYYVLQLFPLWKKWRRLVVAWIIFIGKNANFWGRRWEEVDRRHHQYNISLVSIILYPQKEGKIT